MKLLFCSAAVIAACFGASVANAREVVANVNIPLQTMTVSEDGVVKYQWKVSTGRAGFDTPAGSWSAKWLDKDHRSKTYDNAPMPYAVFFNGGYAVHGTYEVRRLGQPASHGCVRLEKANAETFFALAKDAGVAHTRITISNERPRTNFLADLFGMKPAT